MVLGQIPLVYIVEYIEELRVASHWVCLLLCLWSVCPEDTSPTTHKEASDS